MDPVLLSGLIGAGGSIAGAVVGAFLGYYFANRRANITVFANYRLSVYYLKGQFCLYLPITISNDGNKGTAVYDFLIHLNSHSGQTWLLAWHFLSQEVPENDYAWIDGARAAPIYVHGNSGVQHILKFIAVQDNPDGLSDVVLSPGRYHMQLQYRDMASPDPRKLEYSFIVDTASSEALMNLRNDPNDNKTRIFALKEGGVGESIA